MRVKDFDAAWDALADDPVDSRWHTEMAKYLSPFPVFNPASGSR